MSQDREPSNALLKFRRREMSACNANEFVCNKHGIRDANRETL